ncbi:hypothetical protein PHJA_001684400 [Phtheirospermum japonicum]|uniref:Uncharacterized protein n=1 Tax=Phtheirospermum japonicum TaxID=374723 RepID=A0A830CLX0_9LAMI|nr:hypothetical protein PHJA_001684400 [Phtheirospermum japonicum]
MMSHVMHPRDVAAATDATFQGLADDRYALLSQQLFTHQGLIAKVNYGSRRLMELATELAHGKGRVKHLEGEVTDLQRRLAFVELEREESRKENEALKVSAKEAADAAEEAQMDFYLDGFDDCKQMPTFQRLTSDASFLVRQHLLLVPLPSTWIRLRVLPRLWMSSVACPL